MAIDRIRQIAAMLHARAPLPRPADAAPSIAGRTPARQWRRALAGLAGLALAGLCVGPAAAGPERPTAISINACTDILLVTLADPDQILGVTRYGQDPLQSPVAAEASRYRAVSGSAEEVIDLAPDLVLAGRFTRRATRDFLRQRGTPLVELDAVRSVDEAKRQIAEVAALLGHPERGEAANRAVDAALAEAREAAAQAGSVLILQRRGWVSGDATLMTSLLDAVGLRNVGGAVGGRSGRLVPLERIVALGADYLLVTGEGTAEDQGSALLQHPALGDLYPPERRIWLRDRLVACGGPPLAAAIRSLGRTVGRLAR